MGKYKQRKPMSQKSLSSPCLSLMHPFAHKRTMQQPSQSLQPLAIREKSPEQDALIALSPQDTTRKHQHGRLFIAFITFMNKGACLRTCAGQKILSMSKNVP